MIEIGKNKREDSDSLFRARAQKQKPTLSYPYLPYPTLSYPYLPSFTLPYPSDDELVEASTALPCQNLGAGDVLMGKNVGS